MLICTVICFTWQTPLKTPLFFVYCRDIFCSKVFCTLVSYTLRVMPSMPSATVSISVSESLICLVIYFLVFSKIEVFCPLFYFGVLKAIKPSETPIDGYLGKHKRTLCSILSCLIVFGSFVICYLLCYQERTKRSLVPTKCYGLINQSQNLFQF